MKIQSGPTKFAILATIAVGTAFALRAFAQSAPNKPPPTQEKFVLTINSGATLKDSTPGGEKAFKDLLNYPGKYPKEKGNKLHMKHANPASGEECLPTGAVCSSKLEIQTDKVTVSEIAKNIEAGELTLIQPHVTIQIACPNPDDVKAVLDKLAP
jgi:hypothetical protein